MLLASLASLPIALAARFPYFLSSDFPLNDGGLFVAMSRDLLAAHFALPAFTTYNLAHIPYAYPPLSFYLLAAISGSTGIDAIALDRFVPLIANLATVVAVGALAAELLRSRRAVLLAPCIFALLPRSYEWMIMGGGITRSVGLLCAVSSLVVGCRVFAAPTWKRAALCALLAALALAAHLEEGIFALYSLALMAVLYARTLSALLAYAAVAVGSVLFAAPWWASVILTHGLAPFDAASLTAGWTSLGRQWADLEDFLAPPRVLLSLPTGLAIVGAIARATSSDFFLPVWLPVIFLLSPRSAASQAVVPMALLAAAAIVEVLVPGIAAVAGRSRHSLVVTAIGRASRSRFAIPLSTATSLALLVLIFVDGSRVRLGQHTLDTLSPGDRAAMQWVAGNTPATDRFLVLSPTWSWEEDHVGEWFPVLAERRSLLTPQGAEWLPGGFHARAVCLFLEARALGQSGLGVDALDDWAQGRGVDFSEVYVTQARGGPIDWSPLVSSARASPIYAVLDLGDDLAVLQRRSPIVPRWPATGELTVAPEDCGALADQPIDVQASFEGVYGSRAAAAWVEEHRRFIGVRPSLCRRLEQVRWLQSLC